MAVMIAIITWTTSDQSTLLLDQPARLRVCAFRRGTGDDTGVRIVAGITLTIRLHIPSRCSMGSAPWPVRMDIRAAASATGSRGRAERGAVVGLVAGGHSAAVPAMIRSAMLSAAAMAALSVKPRLPSLSPAFKSDRERVNRFQRVSSEAGPTAGVTGLSLATMAVHAAQQCCYHHFVTK